MILSPKQILSLTLSLHFQCYQSGLSHPIPHMNYSATSHHVSKLRPLPSVIHSSQWSQREFRSCKSNHVTSLKSTSSVLLCLEENPDSSVSLSSSITIPLVCQAPDTTVFFVPCTWVTQSYLRIYVLSLSIHRPECVHFVPYLIFINSTFNIWSCLHGLLTVPPH